MPETLFDGLPDVKVDDAKICVKCGAPTKGFRRPGPGHPTIPYCRVCFYPKRFAYCACSRVKGAKAVRCMTCLVVARLETKVARLSVLKPTAARAGKIAQLAARLENLLKGRL